MIGRDYAPLGAISSKLNIPFAQSPLSAVKTAQNRSRQTNNASDSGSDEECDDDEIIFNLPTKALAAETPKQEIRQQSKENVSNHAAGVGSCGKSILQKQEDRNSISTPSSWEGTPRLSPFRVIRELENMKTKYQVLERELCRARSEAVQERKSWTMQMQESQEQLKTEQANHRDTRTKLIKAQAQLRTSKQRSVSLGSGMTTQQKKDLGEWKEQWKTWKSKTSTPSKTEEEEEEEEEVEEEEDPT